MISVKNNLKTVVGAAQARIESQTAVQRKTFEVTIDGEIREREVDWVTNIGYGAHSLTVIFTSEKDKQGKELNFSYISSIAPKKRDIESFVSGIRSRWNIEDSFNTLKNRGFKGLHKYSRRSFQAYRNWRLTMLIAMLVEQLLVMSKNIAEAFDRSNDTFKNLWESLILYLSDSNPKPIEFNPRMKFSYYK